MTGLVAVIPARGGSKGLARKNLRPLGGRPLISWTIEAARDARSVERVVVSTDDPEIAEVSRQFGADVPFMRPPDLATDEASSIDVLAHAMSMLPPCRQVALLQPTSPLRRAGDIDQAFSLMSSLDAPAVVSVTEPPVSPYLCFRPTGNHRMQPLLDEPAGRRQDMPRTICLNGAIYIAGSDFLLARRSFLSPETVVYEMDPLRSIDIDDWLDLALCEILLTRGVD